MNSLTGLDINGYHIGPLLGAGGMGQVYQATAPDGSAVAIKFLQADYARDPHFQGRFAREIRIMQALKHQNVMPILDQGIYEGELYYTMRLINGTTLSVMFRRRPFTPESFWDILTQLGAALSYGHLQNLVHRDVKPDNVFLERQEGVYHVYLGDFGLGKRVGTDHTLTEADAVLGTPHYLSPEAATGEKLDARSDVYAVAVISYEALLGRLPFNEPQGHLTAMAHVMKPVPRPTSLNPEFPLVLEDVILKGLEKDRDTRCQTIDEFTTDYRKALDMLSEDQRAAEYQVE